MGRLGFGIVVILFTYIIAVRDMIPEMKDFIGLILLISGATKVLTVSEDRLFRVYNARLISSYSETFQIIFDRY